MITLNKQGQWYDFFGNFDVYPSNLCALFWAGVGLPALCITIGVLGFLFVAYSLLGWFHVIALFFGVPYPLLHPETITFVAFVLFVLEAVALAIWFLISGGVAAGKAIGKVAETTGTADVVKQAYQGFKDKYCPLVEWK